VSSWEIATRRGTRRRGRGAGALLFSADPFWLLAGPAVSRGRCAPLAVRLHVCECAGTSAPRGLHRRARVGLSGRRVARRALLFGRPSASKPHFKMIDEKTGRYM
jgi:hypothetical protein